MNIAAGKAIGEVVRSTLGPRGMDKLLVDSAGMGIVTNDGASIIREMNVKHPAANMVATVAKKQEETVGDGTTTAVAVASALLEAAEELLEQGLHPTRIAEGYALAVGAATEELEDAAFEMDDQRDLLEGVVGTAMDGRSSTTAHETLVEVTTAAATAASTAERDPTDHVRVATDVGGDVEGTWLLDGVVLGNERAHAEVPPLVEDADVAVLDGPIEATELRGEAEVTLEDSKRLDVLRSRDTDRIDAQVDHLLELGVDAVITEKDIDVRAQQRLAGHGVYVTRRHHPDDVEAAAQASGATIQTDVEALSATDLGRAPTVAERTVGGELQTSIEGVPQENAVTIVLRGGTRNVVDAVHRTVDNALGTVGVALKGRGVVPGGGGAETLAAVAIRERAKSVDDRLQLAITAFADALEVVPRTLSENAGRSSIDGVVDLRHAYDVGQEAAAINAVTGNIVNARKYGIMDALQVKTQAIEIATQAATMLLRIDDVVAANQLVGGDVTADTDPETDD